MKMQESVIFLHRVYFDVELRDLNQDGRNEGEDLRKQWKSSLKSQGIRPNFSSANFTVWFSSSSNKRRRLSYTED